MPPCVGSVGFEVMEDGRVLEVELVELAGGAVEQAEGVRREFGERGVSEMGDAVAREGDFGHLKVVFDADGQKSGVEAAQAADQPVGGEYEQTRILHGDQ